MLKVLTNYVKVSEAYEIVGEFEFYVGEQKIKIKLRKDPANRFYHDISHYYQSPEQTHSYLYNGKHYDNKEQALSGAVKQVVSSYSEEYGDRYWIQNPNY